MAIRTRFIDLNAYGTGTFTVVLNCAYWSLRANIRGDSVHTIDGSLMLLMVNGVNPDGTVNIAIDYPPIVDADGRPVMWNQVLKFNGGGTSIRGTLMLTYWDPALPGG